MTTLVKRDLIGSSMFNTETSYGARAERRVFVRLDPDDAFVNNTPIGRAIEKAIDGQYHHPDDETLPLKVAKAVQIGKDAFEVSLEYKRSKTSGGALDVPGGSAVANDITNFGGLGFAIGELKLVGVDTDWVNQRSLGAQGFVNELTFAVNYKFKFRQGGHIEEELFYDTSAAGGLKHWDTRYNALGRYSVFENFPI